MKKTLVSLLILSIMVVSNLALGVNTASANSVVLGTPAAGVYYASNLTIGSTGSDVVSLQGFLVANGYLVMPVGVSMGYFGVLTQSALARYQAANGISPAAGYFGPITRAYISSHSSGGPVTSACITNSLTGQIIPRYDTTTGAQVCPQPTPSPCLYDASGVIIPQFSTASGVQLCGPNPGPIPIVNYPPGTTFSLTLSKSGTGSGTVTSNIGSLNCGSFCYNNISAGSLITLVATPNSGSTFVGWSGGGCSGTGTCTLVLNSSVVVNAIFNSATPPPPNANGPIAYIGCSNTWQIVGGYHSDGGTKFWPSDSNYGGGTIVLWGSNLSNSNGYWQEFDSLNAQDPGAKTLWVHLCVLSSESSTDVYNDAVKAIAEAKRRVPTIESVYVSSLNDYAEVGQCQKVGTTGIPYSKSAVSTLVSNGIASAGPVLSVLNQSQTTDGCHPNDAARLLQGNQLLSFFN